MNAHRDKTGNGDGEASPRAWIVAGIALVVVLVLLTLSGWATRDNPTGATSPADFLHAIR